MAMLNFKFSDKNNIRIIYRATTNAPTISQLQNVLNISNPQNYSMGNPNLKQEYTQNFITRISFANPTKSTNFFAFLSGNFTPDPISNMTSTWFKDTSIMGNLIPKNTRVTQPVNIKNNNRWSANTLLTYGFPLYFVKCNMNLNTGFNYTSTPAQIDNRINISNSWTLSQGVVFSSNISEKVDFSLSYTGNYNVAMNSINPTQNNTYYSHAANFKLNWIFWKGLVFQNDLTNQFYHGLSSSNFNPNYFLWNIGLGKKLFANQQGEIKLSVFDLLNQNTGISRIVNATYAYQDTRVNVLKRYFMLTFTYNLKMFKGAPPLENDKGNEHKDFPGGGSRGFYPPHNQ
jgi:hypothetical protein